MRNRAASSDTKARGYICKCRFGWRITRMDLRDERNVSALTGEREMRKTRKVKPDKRKLSGKRFRNGIPLGVLKGTARPLNARLKRNWDRV